MLPKSEHTADRIYSEIMLRLKEINHIGNCCILWNTLYKLFSNVMILFTNNSIEPLSKSRLSKGPFRQMYFIRLNRQFQK